MGTITSTTLSESINTELVAIYEHTRTPNTEPIRRMREVVAYMTQLNKKIQGTKINENTH